MSEPVKFPEKLQPLFEPHRYKVLYGGRGGAKSWGVARALLIRGAGQKIRWLCTREFQTSIRDSVHRLLADQAVALGLESFYDIQREGIYGRNGTEFGFLGLHHNIANLKSWEGADGCWVEEAHTVSDSSWNILIPTIRKEASEIWITMNPEFEDDPTYRRFIERPPKSAILININWRDNPWFPKVLDMERLDLLERDPDAYDHVWEGRCRQWLEGAIYSTELRKLFLDNRVSKVAHDPNVPVYTAWDLGSTDDTAIWWYQVVGGEIHVLESYASNHGSISEYATQILGRKVQVDLIGDDVVAKLGPPIEELAYRREYRYAKHFLPHDARAKTLAAKGKSIIEQLASALTFDMLAIVPNIGIEDGIQAARSMFHRVWFDQEGCGEGIKALRRYQRKFNEDTNSFSRQPLHNWTSHYCLAPETKVLTRYGMYQIMDLPYSGEVLTSCGWKRYENPRITRKNAPLVEVRFSDGLMVRCTQEHQFKTVYGWKFASNLEPGSLVLSSLTLSRSISMVVSTAFGRVINTTHAAVNTCIEKFGNLLSELFPQSATFITKTRIPLITNYETLNVCQQQSISGFQNSTSTASMRLQENAQQIGTSRKKEGFGIVGTLLGLKVGRNGKGKSLLVNFAARYSTSWLERPAILRGFVAQSARFLRIVLGVLMQKRLLVIESVRDCSEKSDVWCLTVPDEGEFSLENGAIVHNSDAFRMMAVSWQHQVKVEEKPSEKEIFRRLMQPEKKTLDQMWAEVRKAPARI